MSVVHFSVPTSDLESDVGNGENSVVTDRKGPPPSFGHGGGFLQKDRPLFTLFVLLKKFFELDQLNDLRENKIVI